MFFIPFGDVMFECLCSFFPFVRFWLGETVSLATADCYFCKRELATTFPEFGNQLAGSLPVKLVCFWRERKWEKVWGGKLGWKDFPFYEETCRKFQTYIMVYKSSCVLPQHTAVPLYFCMHIIQTYARVTTHLDQFNLFTYLIDIVSIIVQLIFFVLLCL